MANKGTISIRGELLDFWKGGADVLFGSLKFGVGSEISNSKHAHFGFAV